MTIAVIIMGLDKTSLNANPKCLKLNSIRFSLVTLSSILNPIHIVLMATNAMNIKKIARQWKTSITNDPRSGAIAGTKANIIIIKDEIRAISRPW